MSGYSSPLSRPRRRLSGKIVLPTVSYVIEGGPGPVLREGKGKQEYMAQYATFGFVRMVNPQGLAL